MKRWLETNSKVHAASVTPAICVSVIFPPLVWSTFSQALVSAGIFFVDFFFLLAKESEPAKSFKCDFIT